MLTFLRKIRKSLMESGSFQKYFLYAIGEIALVVIGILIALQINIWNEAQKEKAKAFDYLSEFKKDLMYDTLQFNYMLLLLDKTIRSDIKILENLEHTSEELNDILTVVTSNTFSRTINQRTFQKIQNSGNSNLLGYEALYDQLSNYYIETNRDLNLSLDWQINYFQKNRGYLDKFIEDNNYEVFTLRDDLKEEFQIDSFPRINEDQDNPFIHFFNTVAGRNYANRCLLQHGFIRNKYKSYTSLATSLLVEIDKVTNSK